VQQSFEDVYLRLRADEHRVYSDEIVVGLPLLSDPQLLKIPSIVKEWKIRSRSTEKLIQYLNNKSPHSILELGCGNGWLSHRLAAAFPLGTVMAMDINTGELTQADRVFGALYHNLTFKYVDIFSHDFGDNKFDCIILAGTMQYFSDLKKLINILSLMLKTNGEIHLLDSPIYNPGEVAKAKVRSDAYFDKCGCPEMKTYYHHHSWEQFKGFNYYVQYNPLSFWNRLGQRVRNDSPFPWVIIR